MTPLAWRSSSGFYVVVLEDEHGNLVVDEGRDPFAARYVFHMNNAMTRLLRGMRAEALAVARGKTRCSGKLSARRSLKTCKHGQRGAVALPLIGIDVWLAP